MFLARLHFLFFMTTVCSVQSVRYDVYNSANLYSFMNSVVPGDELVLHPGIFNGNFYSYNDGTASRKITIRSADPSNKAVIRGLDYSYNIALYVSGNHWVIKDLVVSNAQKGIVFDNAIEGAIMNCEIRDTGECIMCTNWIGPPFNGSCRPPNTAAILTNPMPTHPYTR
jgi:hypothetical protein